MLGGIECLYPLTGSQARSFLMVYTPWSRRFPHEAKPNDVLVRLFEEFLKSQQCPPSLKYAYLKAKDTYNGVQIITAQPPSVIIPFFTKNRSHFQKNGGTFS